ncbi:MAG: hypothetical protein NZ693_00285 [Thermoflexales bacterium]|nr:hypothetical protein [Thermoflexales bacterium]
MTCAESWQRLLRDNWLLRWQRRQLAHDRFRRHYEGDSQVYRESPSARPENAPVSVYAGTHGGAML